MSRSSDQLPTVCAAAGIALPKNDTFDGINLLPLLTGQTEKLMWETVFWQINLYKKLQRHYPKPRPYATEIAQKGMWKLLAKDGDPVELFDIESDLYEKQNLLKENPKIAGELRKQHQAWLAEPRRQFGNQQD